MENDMTTTFSIKAMNATPSEFKEVKEFKYKYIDYAMHNGIYYNVCGFVSSCLNHMLDHFNKPEDLTFNIGGYEARQCDLDDFRAHGKNFLKVLAKRVPEPLYLHVEDVLNRTIDALEAMTVQARKDREKELDAQQAS